jgi:hypothetical protein
MRTTLIIKTLSKDTQNKALSINCCNAERRYAEFRYDERRYAECRGVLESRLIGLVQVNPARDLT